ncbi:MAG: lipoyl(octanoyl) transferase LipB [Sphingomonas sp.]|jgi:lipoyl(octanoyl) transferase
MTGFPNPLHAIDWEVAEGLVPYAQAVERMAHRAEQVAQGQAPELVWLLEHPPIYTAGTSADAAELLDARFPVHVTGRGGRYTYHGPGQRIGYLILNLNRHGRDVRRYVHALEGWLVAALARLGVSAFTAPGRVGIWTLDGGEEAKIGAIGVRVKRWVTLHGFALNVAPDLGHFGGIVPCGLPDFAVTSLQKMHKSTDFGAVDAALLAEFDQFLTLLRGVEEF